MGNGIEIENTLLLPNYKEFLSNLYNEQTEYEPLPEDYEFNEKIKQKKKFLKHYLWPNI